VILKLLKSPNHQPEAYHQINEFIVTAKSDLIAIVDRKVLSEVAKTHTREDLDEYIVLWKRIMPGTANRTLYPNMEERFKNTKVAQSNGYLSRRLVNA
jgi:sigma54-dependent transcription regulator